MPTVDRVLPWRRNERPPGGRGRPPAGRLPGPAPQGAHRPHRPRLPHGRRRPPGPVPPLRRALHPAPARRGSHRRRPRPRRRHGGRRPPPRRGGGHRRHPRRPGGRLRRRRDGHRRRRHQARPHQVRHQGGPAGGLHAQDARRHGQGPAGPDHQARPTGSTTCARSPPCRSSSRSARRARRSTSTPRWPTGSGMQEVRQELEDLSFAALHPKRYAEIDHMVSTRSPERDLYLTQVLEQVRERLAELRINAEVTGRPKHLYSIYEKMVVKGREFDDIFDLVGIRVIVDSVKDCYAALGSIHATWKPVQGRFKDYVAMPKFNLYQSLHTTVVGPQGKPLEVQIRTWEMHARAEQGVAAHWQYKDVERRRHQRRRLAQPDRRLAVGDPGPRRVHGQPEDRPRAGRGLRLHPQGQGRHPRRRGHAHRLRLRHPHRGRPRLHRRAGQRAPRARSTPSSRPATRWRSSPPRWRAPGPSRDWQHIVATPRAAAKIRQWFSRERREDAVETGREELVKALRREGLPVQKLAAGHAARRHRQGAELRRPRRALRGGGGEPRLGQGDRGAHRPQAARGRPRPRRGGREAPDHGAPAAASGLGASARRPACTSRASTT